MESLPNLAPLIDKLQNDINCYSAKIANQQFTELRSLIINKVEQTLRITDLNDRMSEVPTKKGRPTTKKIIYVALKTKSIVSCD